MNKACCRHIEVVPTSFFGSKARKSSRKNDGIQDRKKFCIW